MCKVILKKLILASLLCFFSSCYSQTKPPQMMNDEPQNIIVNREPAVAGQFYPGKKNELMQMLGTMFSKAEMTTSAEVLAVIVPHAGYVFSGEVAASGFNRIDKQKKYQNIFVIGSSHRSAFEGASIYSKGNFLTPLGIVNVNMKLAEKLIKDNNIFAFGTDAHKHEHSLEVELPFLQYMLKNNFSIVPILLGTQNPVTCKKIADALKPYFNSDNLFVISTDFSHYPEYNDAIATDKITANAIMTNSADLLLKAIKSNESKGIDGLVTSLCGWTSVLTLLYMTSDLSDLKFNQIAYKNSGDSEYGEKTNVVGYHAITVEGKLMPQQKKNELMLTAKDKSDLLQLARQTINEYIKNNTKLKIKTDNYSENLQRQYGAFVTLHKHGELRGCIGRFTTEEPLCEVVRDMAVSAATEDPRFDPVNTEEIGKLKIEISVLSPMKKINSIDEIEMGRHGIYIKKGYSSGTFLPQVAKETKWSKDEFLGHCSRDKAGIGWDGWKDKDTEIYIYEAFVFSE